MNEGFSDEVNFNHADVTYIHTYIYSALFGLFELRS